MDTNMLCLVESTQQPPDLVSRDGQQAGSGLSNVLGILGLIIKSTEETVQPLDSVGVLVYCEAAGLVTSDGPHTSPDLPGVILLQPLLQIPPISLLSLTLPYDR